MLLLPYFPYLRLLLTALDAVKRASGDDKLMLNRGVKLDLVSTYPDAYKEDGLMVWWPFSSCTRKVKVLDNEMFLGTSGNRTLFQARRKRDRRGATRMSLPRPVGPPTLVSSGQLAHIACTGAHEARRACEGLLGDPVGGGGAAARRHAAQDHRHP